MTSEPRYLRRANLTVRRVDDETFILDLDGRMLHKLSGVGVAIWDWLDKERSLSDLVDLILERYDVDRDTAEADCRRFLDELSAQNLVVASGAEENA